MKAQVKTKSNFRNLNGKWVTILQFLGTIVYCQIENENGEKVNFDLSLNEIVSIKQD